MPYMIEVPIAMHSCSWIKILPIFDLFFPFHLLHLKHVLRFASRLYLGYCIKAKFKADREKLRYYCNNGRKTQQEPGLSRPVVVGMEKKRQI